MFVNKLSIIGTSQGGRILKIKRLLDSVSELSSFCEIIFVDQSQDDEIKELFNSFNGIVNYKIICTNKISLSKARNIAIKECSGNIICFCDDDAFYDKSIFYYLSSIFRGGDKVYTFPVIDYDSKEYYGNRKFPKDKKILGFNDVIKYCLSVSIFVCSDSNDWIKKNIYFDENLGVGTPIGGSEETDLMFTLLGKGIDITYLPSHCVYHDNDYNENANVESLKVKYRAYAKGYSYVAMKHMVASRFCLLLELINIVFRSLVGVVISKHRKLYLHRLLGLIDGFKSYRNVE